VQPLLPTTLHHLIIALRITCDKNNFRAKPCPRISQQLHGIGPTAALLGVPKYHALRLNVLVYEAGNGRAKGALLVRADPDKEPVGRLNAGGERGANTGAGADADAAGKHGGRVTYTG
jgi:hypothetical protein